MSELPEVVVGNQDEADAMALHLQEIKRVLREGKAKVEFGFAFHATGTVQTAQVWEHVDTPHRYSSTMTKKWVKVGPFLTTKEGTRSSLFTLLAHLSEAQ